MQNLNLEIKPSKILFCLLVITHGVMFILTAQLQGVNAYIKVLLLSTIIIALVAEIRSHILRIHPLAIKNAWQLANGEWRLRLHNQEIIPVTLKSDLFLTTFFAILYFTHAENPKRRYNLILFKDALPEDVFRKAYVYLTTA